ncbi:tryptophan/tyrosine permease [Gammaproteobacteria bacterium]|nr:tryptophan/tyrosine permease [Gammaproteobacteria bacterium]
MDTRIAGGILLIVGTSIGGGMLALPMATAEIGFIFASLMLIAVWAIMTISAFFVLEVNLWFPTRNNMITMAKATLGRWGEVAAWLSYLLLLYALLTAYVSGGAALFDEISSWFKIHFSLAVDSILFVIVFGFIVYKGIKPVDYFNRFLMILKLGALFLIIFMAIPYIKIDFLISGNPVWLTSVVTVMMTSFGFATIVPSLRSYFNDDIKKLRTAILVGSLIPLVCYILWEFAILGSVPRVGEHGLLQIIQHGGSATDLSQVLSVYLKKPSITALVHLFTVICVLTAFLGVSLCLVDFLSDGLKINKETKKGWLVYFLTFIPPLAIVLFKPNIFIKAFDYAGICALILIVLLPAMMVWRGRYVKKFSSNRYQVIGGKSVLILIFIFSFFIIGLSFYNIFF